MKFSTFMLGAIVGFIIGSSGIPFININVQKSLSAQPYKPPKSIDSVLKGSMTGS
jgi:hypothetical protein